MMRAQPRFLEGQGTTVQGLRFGETALGGADRRQVVEADGELERRWSAHAIQDLDRVLVESLRLLQPALPVEKGGQRRAVRGHVGMIGTQLPHADGQPVTRKGLAGREAPARMLEAAEVVVQVRDE